jgi:hypothetical protein
LIRSSCGGSAAVLGALLVALETDKVFQKFPVEQPTEWPPLTATSHLIFKNKEESAKISVKVQPSS